MSIVVLDDVILSQKVMLAGLSGRLTRQNVRGINQGGFATVNAARDVSLREYSVGVKPMLLRYWAEVVSIWEVTDSGVYGFLIEDPTNSTVSNDLGGLQGYMSGVEFGTPGYGNGTPLYGLRQIRKVSNKIVGVAVTRPKGAPVLTRDGSPVSVGGSAGNISLGSAPVYVTFVADASQPVNAVTVGATTQVTLASALSGLVVGGRLWLQDLNGADAALLNNMSHEITNISTATYTLATNTAGKTISAAGTGKKYPQPDEALNWSGPFYVPVQFAEDELDWSLERPGKEADRLVSGNSVRLIEVRET